MNKRNYFKNKGFTLLEMVISIAIFAFLTAFLVAKYGSFNQGILLTNLAYDIALTIRNAQSYGLNVKSVPVNGSNYSDTFDKAYGVHFDKVSPNNAKIIFFADLNDNKIYDSSPTDEMLSTYTLKRGFIIKEMCTLNTSGSCNGTYLNTLDITFKRPNPDAMLSNGSGALYKSGKITLQLGTDTTAQKGIIISDSGQITVSR